MSEHRQLAAVMFTDIVGYTALMGEDEKKAFAILRGNRKMQQRLIKQYDGTWIKELGDGTLASFDTVTDAIQCAIVIQQSCNSIPDLKLRIGIHLSEVLFEDNDVFGEGVNIASRIQALAPIGGIWISEVVNKNVTNRKEIVTKFIKEEILKNVKEPVRIYEVDIPIPVEKIVQVLDSEEYLREFPEKSIAVLPFVNMSNDPDQEYFSDGMAEEIINSLVHIQDLRVAGRMSSFQFKGTRADLREVGEKLGVNTVLEGSVRKQKNKLRVSTQLINVEDGFNIWSEKYDRTIDDIFAIQDEIALAITEKLKVTWLDKDRSNTTRTYTQNTEAYELYLKGRFHTNRRGVSLLTGIKCFQKAIEVDPEFALAHAGYADAIALTASYGIVRPREVMNKIKESAERAIQLNPSLCEPYCSLGFYYTCFEWNWKEAKKNFLKCIEINPQYSQAHYWYGWNYLVWVEGDFSEAEKHGEFAVKLEPLSAICYGFYSLILYAGSKFQEALVACKTGIELDPNSFLCHLNEGNVYMVLQQYEAAFSSYENCLRLSNRHHIPLNCLIWAYCLTGNIDKAHALMNELKERSKTEYIGCTFTGVSAAYLDNLDEAFDYLDKAYNDKDPILLSLKNEPWGPATLRNDPRFQKLLDRIGSPLEVSE